MLLFLLGSCRQESVQERAYRLLTASMEAGGKEIRQRNRVEAMRFTYAITAQGNRSEDTVYANDVEAFSQGTDSILRYIDHTRSGLQPIVGSQGWVRTYLMGDATHEGQGKLYSLYQLLLNHQKSLLRVMDRDAAPSAVFPSVPPKVNSPHDPLRGFLQPFLVATGAEAEALLVAYRTHISLLHDAVLEHAQGRVGARIIRDNFSAPLRANPRRDSVKRGAAYEADLYVSFGLHDWFLYQTIIDGKPVASSRPTATLTATCGKDGKPQQWEARLYLFNDYDEDTVLVVRRPFPLYKRNTPGERP